MGEYRFEELKPAAFPELVGLMDDAFGRRTPRNYFDWKYAQNPAGPAVGQIARAANGEIAAFYGMIPMQFQGPDGPTTIFQSCDTMTSSRHRRKGLFQQLAERLYAAELDRDPNLYIYGFGGPTSTPGFLKMGWRVVDEVPYLFEPWPLTSLRSMGRSAANPDNESIIPETSSIAPEGSLIRSPAFMAWKTRNPLRKGYVTLRDGRALATCSTAGDFTFLIHFQEGGASSTSAVLNGVRKQSRGSKGILTFAQPTSEMHRALRARGYLRNPLGRGPASGTVPLIAYGKCPWSEDRWAVTPLDHDAY